MWNMQLNAAADADAGCYWLQWDLTIPQMMIFQD